MKRTVVSTTLSLALVPALVASCMADAPSRAQAPAAAPEPARPAAPGVVSNSGANAAAGGPDALTAGQAERRIEREVTLRIDPLAGTIAADASPQLLAVIEADLALDFDVANLRHAGGQTSFLLVARNRGSGVTALSFRTTGERTLAAPAQPVVLGDIGPGAEATATLTFDNAAGSAFNVTLWLTGTLVARGGVGTDGQAASLPPSSAPTATPAPSSAPTQTPAPAASPTPVPTVSPTPSGSPTPVATPTPTASATPGATPTPYATPVATTPPAPVENPGPSAARGRILMNGKPSWTPISLSLVKTPGWTTRTVTTDAQGYFGASDLEPGDYLAYFYNDSQRERIGYWRSRAQKVDATTGAAFPTVDFYQKGLLNDPPMDARRSFPVTFAWSPQTQTVDSYRFRLHSTSGRTYTLIHQSDRIPGTATTFTWDGSGVASPLSATNRYFWGMAWDAGPVGEGGNLFQAIYFNP